MEQRFSSFMRRFVAFLDPKLAPYRPPTPPTPPPAPWVPEDTADFIKLIQRTPKAVLSSKQRRILATVMSAHTLTVRDLMLPASPEFFLRSTQVLSPSILDHLYQSGLSHFPVFDAKKHLLGILDATPLFNLENLSATSIKDLLNPQVFFLNESYTLSQAISAFLRTNQPFFLVVNKYQTITGFFSLELLFTHLFQTTFSDSFTDDNNLAAVAKR